MNIKNINYKKSGFSLLEISIVIAIIAVLSTMIMKVTDISLGARTQALIREQYQMRLAISNFYKKFDTLPGDMYDTSIKLGLSTKGNGNGRIDAINIFTTNHDSKEYTEVYMTWEQISVANLIKENYNGYKYSSQNPSKPAFNIPICTIFKDNNIGYFVSFDPAIGKIRQNPTIDKKYHVMEIGNFSNQSSVDGRPLSGALRSEVSKYLDIKIDDGNPLTGFVLSIRAGLDEVNNVQNTTELQTCYHDFNESVTSENYYKNAGYLDNKSVECITLFLLNELHSELK